MSRAAFALVALLTAGCGLVKVEGPSGSPVHVSSAQPGNEAGPAAGPPSESTAAWRAAVRSAESEMAAFVELATKPPKPGDTSPDQRVERALRLRKSEKLAEIAKNCAAKAYDGERTGEDLRAANVCPLLAKRDALMVQAARAWADAETDRRINELSQNVEKMKKSGRASVTDAVKGRNKESDRTYILSFVGKYYEAVGQPPSEELLAKVDKVAEGREAALVELAGSAKTTRASARDAGAERAVADLYAKRQPGIQIQSVRMIDSDWKPVRDSLGQILRRYKDAEVIVKAKSGAYCLAVPASVGQPYLGGGNYSNVYGVDEFLEGFPTRCPK